MATATTGPGAAAAVLRCHRRRILPFSLRLQKRSSSVTSPRASPHSAFRAVEEVRPETLEHRVFFFPADPSGNSRISPWHDIPLRAGDGALNCVVEIPRGTRAKMEVATTERHNPIKQDTRTLDVVEIGGLTSEGELDWKIVAISLDSPRASLANDANENSSFLLRDNLLQKSSDYYSSDGF